MVRKEEMACHQQDSDLKVHHNIYIHGVAFQKCGPQRNPETYHGGDGAPAMLRPRSAKISGWKEQRLPVSLHAWPESVMGLRTH